MVKTQTADDTILEAVWESRRSPILFLDSSAVEHSAVNRRVVGSKPTRGALRPVGQAVKTPPFHGGITSSILVQVIFISGAIAKW